MNLYVPKGENSRFKYIYEINIILLLKSNYDCIIQLNLYYLYDILYIENLTLDKFCNIKNVI